MEDVVSTKWIVSRMQSGVWIPFWHGKSNGEMTSNSRCFLVQSGNYQRPINESELKAKFKMPDGSTPNPAKIDFGRKYRVCPTVSPEAIIVSEDVCAEGIL